MRKAQNVRKNEDDKDREKALYLFCIKFFNTANEGKLIMV